MATPVPLSETYHMLDGSIPPNGSAVTFTLTAPLTDTITGAVIAADPIRVPLAAGVLAATLYATDDPTTSPTGVTYRADVVLGTETYALYFALPYNSGPQVLGLLAPADVAPPVTYGISSIVAVPPLSGSMASGVYTVSIDGSGFTTDAELAAEASTRALADSSEATTRAGADTALNGLITAEAGTARAAESANAGALTTHSNLTTGAHGGLVSSADARLTDARTPLTHTHTHASTTGQTADDHHAKSHVHSGDGSGTLGTAAIPDLSAVYVPIAHAALTSTAHGGIVAPGGVLRPVKVGYYLGPACPTTTGTKPQAQANYQPLVLTQAQTLDQLLIETTVAGASGSVTRVGIHNSTADGLPGTVLLDAGTIDTTVTPALLSKTINQALAAGVYWLVVVTQGSPATAPTYRCNGGPLPGCQGSTAADAFLALNGYYQTGVSGALATAAITGAIASSTRVIVRFSA